MTNLLMLSSHWSFDKAGSAITSRETKALRRIFKGRLEGAKSAKGRKKA